MAPASPAAIAVVLVCHDHAESLPRTLGALAAQRGPDDEVVVVDNASSDGSAGAARRADPSAVVLDAGGNVGFAAGCHLGVRASRAPLVFLLNPDTVPEPGCLDALRRCAAERPGWGAFQALVTLEDGVRVNTAGNLVHLLGFGWAGDLDRPVAAVDGAPREVGFASGAALLVRREAWDQVGGFDERYFMYAEDLDLSLRLRLAGWGVGAEPRARVTHDYTFTKGDYKWFYLERNRWWTVLGTYPPRLLALMAPALLAFEVALLFFSWRGGWLRPKLRANAAVARELPAILRRRRAIQARRVVGERDFARHLTPSLDSPNLAAASAIPGLEAAMRAGYRLLLAVL